MVVERMLIATTAALIACGCVGRPEALTLEGPHQETIESASSVLAISFSKDSRFLGQLTQDGLNLWDVLREEVVWEKKLSQEFVGHMDLANRSRVATVTDRGIHIHDLNSDAETTWPLPDRPISFVRFDESAEHLLAASQDSSVRIWRVADSTIVDRFALPAGETGWRPVPSSGFGVVFLHESGKVRVLDPRPGGIDCIVECERALEGSVAVAIDGKVLASVNPHGAIEIRRLADGEITATLSGFEAFPQSLALSPDGSVLAVAVANTAVELWDTRTSERLEVMESSIWPGGEVVFSPNGNSLAWVEGDRTKVKHWSPVLSVMELTSEGPALIEAAQQVCHDTASVIRFRLARVPFTRGMEHLESNRLVEARQAFAEAKRYFPVYPGLAASASLADARYEASIRAEEVGLGARALIALGEFDEALAMLDGFLKQYGKFGEYDFRKRADALRAMSARLESAEAHRLSGDAVSALVEFNAGVAQVPELAEVHPEYGELRKQTLARLDRELEESFDAKDDRRFLRLYADSKRLDAVDSRLLLRAGRTHERLGHPEEAGKVYAAIEMSAAEYVEARRSIARIARESGDLARAVAVLVEARKVAPEHHGLAVDSAEASRLAKNYDQAVTLWQEIARMRSMDPEPFERIAAVEEEREAWKRAGSAYYEAVRRSDHPRPRLLLKVAESFGKAGMSRRVVDAYLELLDFVENNGEVPSLGDDPRQTLHKRIRELGFVHHRGDWIHRDRFLSQQGWVFFNGEWVRPEEVKLREVAADHAETQEKDLRVSSDSYYEEMARNKRISNGMNRREVIEAWGFFEDQNIVTSDGGETVFEQLLFENSRQVYLKNGRVCFWSE